jgi:nitrate/nitrite-specific signal transduction histidine kinase
VAIVFSALLILWLSRRITRPIRELTLLSERMADLDFDAKYTSGGSDEIGQLGEHFNRMSGRLEQTISQLKSANNELQKDIEKKIQIDDIGEMKKNDENFTVKIKHDSILIENET